MSGYLAIHRKKKKKNGHRIEGYVFFFWLPTLLRAVGEAMSRYVHNAYIQAFTTK